MQVRSLPKVSSKRHIWTKEEEEYFKSIINGRHYKDIVELMQNKFGYVYNAEQLKKKAKRLGISTRLTGGFKEGINFNYGFKVGAESKDRNGYIKVKVAEPNVWELKHRMIWEKVNGKVPEGYNLLFADKNKSNTSLDNLLLVSVQELMMMTKFNLIKTNKELTVTGLNIARLILKISEVKKR